MVYVVETSRNVYKGYRAFIICSAVINLNSFSRTSCGQAGFMFVAKVNEIQIRDVCKVHLYFMLKTQRKLIKLPNDRLIYVMKLKKHNL